MDFDPDNYAEYGFTDGLYHEEDRDGVTAYVTHIPQNSTLNGNAFITGRLTARLQLTEQAMTWSMITMAKRKFTRMV